MAKYRLLTKAELQELEKEFIDYLVLNGITGEDWVKMKQNSPDKANQIVELFSEVIFESILRKCTYLEYLNHHEIKCFQCLAEKLVLVAMTADPQSEANFKDAAFIQKATTNPPPGIRIFTSEKSYSKNREEELFGMLEAGCTISDGKLFKALCMVLPSS